MTAENFNKSLRTFQGRTPFRPYMVELTSGAKIVVYHPEALVYRSGVGVYFGPDGSLTILDHEGVSRVTSDIEQASAGPPPADAA